MLELNKEILDNINKKLPNAPEYDLKQMRAIKLGLKHELNIDEIKLYADPKYDGDQMREILYGILYARNKFLNIEQVKAYADSKYDWKQMREIRDGFLRKFTTDEMKLYIDPKFSWEQMHEILCGILVVKKYGDNMEKVKLYADPKFSAEQMHEIFYSFASTRVSVNGNKLSIDQVKLYADPKYNLKQMKEIQLGYQHGLTKEQILTYANPKFSEEQMGKIRKDFENDNMKNFLLEIDQSIDMYNEEQKIEIKYGFCTGLRKKQVALYADPKYDADKMALIRLKLELIMCGLEQKLTFEEINEFANPEFSAEQILHIINDMLQ